MWYIGNKVGRNRIREIRKGFGATLLHWQLVSSPSHPMYLDDVQCGKVSHNSNFRSQIVVDDCFSGYFKLACINTLLVICAVPYMNVLEDYSRLVWLWCGNAKKWWSLCLARFERRSFTFKFLDYQKTWSLPRDILFLSYGCVVLVLNWWY